MNNEKIDNSLTEIMTAVDDKLTQMTIEEKKKFIGYLLSAIEDLETNIEYDLLTS